MKGNERPNRLLVVCMCMIMILMGLWGLSASDVEAKGGGKVVYIHYCGPDIQLVSGINLITPLCQVHNADNSTMTPHDLMDTFTWTNGTPNPNGVFAIWTRGANNVGYEYYHWNNSFHGGRAFTIDMMKSYYVDLYGGVNGYFDLNSGPAGTCWVPKLYQQILSNTYSNLLGPMIPFVGNPNDPPPPDPPPPFSPWYFMASDMHGYFFDHDGNPFTGGYILSVWNTTTDNYQTYDGSPSSDFVIYGEGYGGFVGNYHTGFEIFVYDSGVTMRCVIPW